MRKSASQEWSGHRLPVWMMVDWTRLHMSQLAKSGLSSLPMRVCSGFFIFLLAVALFGWGLHSKLSLYDAHPEAQASVPIAKLLSEQERPSGHQLQRFHAPPVELQAVVLVLIPAAIPSVRSQLGERQDERAATPVVFSFSGPSLLRPPPAHAA